MKSKISKSQIEVWDWKKKASEELSNIPSKDIINFIAEKVSATKFTILKNRKAKYSGDNDDISIVADK